MLLNVICKLFAKKQHFTWKVFKNDLPLQARKDYYYRNMKRIRLFMTTVLLAFLTTGQAQKYVGGDISLLPTYEEHSANYMDQDGQPIADMLSWLKEQGWNSVRVRLFVDPSLAPDKAKGEGVRQDLEYVKAFGKRIKEAGLDFMLDFHYSDTWADPAHQATPASWIPKPNENSIPTEEIIYQYTKDCLEQLVAANAAPDFIQTGNEISWGMLWEEGCKLEAKSDWSGYKDDNWDKFSEMLKSAGKACREVCPDAKIIIHTEQAANTPLVTDFYQRIADNGVDYDIIGTSYYPYYHGSLTQLEKTITQWETTFPNKKIMVVETGCAYHWAVGDNDQGYELSYEGQRKFTADLIAMLNKHGNVNGLFWWFPEANEYGLDWDTQRVTDAWYNAGLFDNETGRALPALYELKNFCDGGTGIRTIQSAPTGDKAWYSLQGHRLESQPSQTGIYINNKKKVIIK
jgi:arabinogalactan endo-1,4-beta-galactosidase